MRNPLKRYYGRGDLHFVTFSCYRRRPFLRFQLVERKEAAGETPLHASQPGGTKISFSSEGLAVEQFFVLCQGRSRIDSHRPCFGLTRSHIQKPKQEKRQNPHPQKRRVRHPLSNGAFKACHAPARLFLIGVEELSEASCVDVAEHGRARRQQGWIQEIGVEVVAARGR